MTQEEEKEQDIPFHLHVCSWYGPHWVMHRRGMMHWRDLTNPPGVSSLDAPSLAPSKAEAGKA